MANDRLSIQNNGDVERHVAAADGYALLAILMQMPAPDTKDLLLHEGIAADYQAIVAELGGDSAESSRLSASFRKMQEELSSQDDPLGVLRREYTRAFAHPRRPPIKIYEGLFVDDERERLGKEKSFARLFVSPAAMDAERQYARAGLKCDTSEKRISADCITTELQFMQHLHELFASCVLQGDEDKAEEVEGWLNDFKEKHVSKWIPRFFERCSCETQHDFYRLVGQMGLSLLELDGVQAVGI